MIDKFFKGVANPDGEAEAPFTLTEKDFSQFLTFHGVPHETVQNMILTGLEAGWLQPQTDRKHIPEANIKKWLWLEGADTEEIEDCINDRRDFEVRRMAAILRQRVSP